MQDNATQERLLKKMQALEDEIETYRILIDNSPDLIYRTDLDGRVTFVSGSVYKLSGYTPEEAIGMKMAEDVYLYPQERENFLNQIQEKGYVTNFEAQLKKKDGSIWWAATNAHYYRNKDGEIIGVEGVARDISELKAAEKALRESEERFRTAFQTSPDSINLNLASNGLYVDINEGFTKIMGYSKEDVIGKTSLSLDIWKNPEDRQRVVDTLNKYGHVENLEAEFLGKDGNIRIGLMSARFIEINGRQYILSITRDITERKKLQQQLQQTHKFEAIATLAGGIAHDFNNLLMVIQGHTSLVLADLDPSHPHSEHMKAIENYIRSAAELTKQLLGLAQGGKYEVKPTEINEIIDKSAKLFGRTKKEIQIHTKYKEPPPVVDIDRTQIEQVLLNLFVNAWQAMPDGGQLYLETQDAMLDETYCKSYRVKPGRYVKISVTDTGVGIDKSLHDKIFDPFFTTKEKGRGTGFGLASAFGIIKNHGGIITVDSELGHGASFIIYLPLSKNEACSESTSQKAVVKGSETILLVDDEDIILKVGKEMLEKLGYNVFIADSGEQALKVLSELGDNIDLVILDLVMPGMNGSKIFDGIKEIRPHMPVLISSGYAINGQVEKILNKGGEAFIQKPFNLSEISQKIREIIDKTE